LKTVYFIFCSVVVSEYSFARSTRPPEIYTKLSAHASKLPDGTILGTCNFSNTKFRSFLESFSQKDKQSFTKMQM